MGFRHALLLNWILRGGPGPTVAQANTKAR